MGVWECLPHTFEYQPDNKLGKLSQDQSHKVIFTGIYTYRTRSERNIRASFRVQPNTNSLPL